MYSLTSLNAKEEDEYYIAFDYISDIQVQADEVATDSDENHDYLIYIEDIDTIKAYKDDNKIKIETKHEVVDRYTGEDETDRIKFPVSQNVNLSIME